ncbi:MAG TPA: GreA/GreB family elongation factor [Actinomycetota bacterium]|nr:GreA/GreB family elongation factor [Actinomycetota bacterium]
MAVTDTIDDTPVLTPEGRRMIEARVRRLREEVLPQLVDALRESEDDGRDAFEYARVEGELLRLTGILAAASVLSEPGASRRQRRFRLGDEVELRFPDGEAERFLIVHPAEAPLDDRRISAESPLGEAILGREPGDEVVVRAPGEDYRCRLVRWSRGVAGRTLVAEVLAG